MKILFLHMTMGLSVRGSEVVIDTLATELVKQHHQVLVVQSGPVTKKPYRIKRVFPLSLPPQPGPKNLWEKIIWRLKLDPNSAAVSAFTRAALPTISHFNPEIIVAVNGAPQLKALQGRTLKAKLVVFGHAGIGHDDRSVLRAVPDLFIALTRASFTWAKQLSSPRTKVVYLPNPFNPSKISQKKPIALHLPPPVILTVSALSPYKNVTQVIKASKLVDTSLILVGDGEISGEIAKLFSSYPHDFRWIRSLEHPDLLAYYPSVQAFCFVPDKQEAFGLVYLEAMAAGLPIVGSDDEIRRELIGPSGIYVDPHDLKSIAAGIKRALTLGRVNYTKQLAPYEPKNIVRQLVKEFHDLTR